VVLVLIGSSARADSLLDGLATDDPAALAAAIAAIERAPASTPELASARFSAARACEDRLGDLERALALYEQIMRDTPDAGIAIAASRRAEFLAARLGRGTAHAASAAAFAHLVIEATDLPPATVTSRADALAATPDWPGAPDVLLWLADYLRNRGDFDAALARYRRVADGWPATPQGLTALRAGSGCALEAGDWELGLVLARALPVDDPFRADQIALAIRGRTHGRLYTLAWLVAIGALVGFAVSLAHANRWRRPSLVPPIEVLFLAPIAAVLVGIAFTTHALIAPAVLTVAVGGLAITWLSGAALDALRASDRPVRRRIALHIALAIGAVVALAYIALVRDHLLDLTIETFRFGPD
jgi:tetratricopeptide (TPR) repeat protein